MKKQEILSMLKRRKKCHPTRSHPRGNVNDIYAAASRHIDVDRTMSVSYPLDNILLLKKEEKNEERNNRHRTVGVVSVYTLVIPGTWTVWELSKRKS